MSALRAKIPTLQNYLICALFFLFPLYPFGMEFVAKLIFIFWLLDPNLKQNFSLSYKTNLGRALLFFFFLFVASAISFEKPFLHPHAKEYKVLLLGILLLAYINKALFERILVWFVLGVFFTMLLGLIFYFGILPNSWLRSSDVPLSPYIDHGVFALCVIFAITILALHIARNGAKQAWGALMLLVFMVFYLFLNKARVGHLFFVALVPFMVFYLYGFSKKRVFAIILVIFGFVGLVYSFHSTANAYFHYAISDIKKIIQEKDYTTSWGNRAGDFLIAIESIKKDPILGVGVGGEKIRHDEVVKDLGLKKDWHHHIHGQFAQILIAHGLVGLVLWLGVMFGLIFVVPKRHNSKDLRVLSTFFGVVMLMYSMTNTVLAAYTNYLFVIFVAFFSSTYDDNFSFAKLKLDSLKKTFFIILFALLLCLLARLDYHVSVHGLNHKNLKELFNG